MIVFCFCAFAWSEGTGGRDGGREGGGFFLGKHTNSLTFLTDLVPFPLYLDFPQENVHYLKENIRYMVFLGKRQFSLHFWTDLVPFPRVLTKTYVWLLLLLS